MKAILSLLIAISLTPALAKTKSTIYCKVEGKVLNIYNEDKCEAAVRGSMACFTGDEDEVAALINSGQFNWDEQWIEAATVRGANRILYYYVDGPNEGRHEALLKRCTNSFFHRRH